MYLIYSTATEVLDVRVLWIREMPLGSLALINGTQGEKEALIAPFYVFFEYNFSHSLSSVNVSDRFLLSIIFVDFMQSARDFPNEILI